MKKLSIEQFLTWAFTQELCKVGSGSGGSFVSGSSWEMVSEFFTLGTMIDRSPNHYGVIPDFVTAQTDPHPDAVVAGNAVRRLAERGGFEIGSGWSPFPEWSDDRGLIAVEVQSAVEALVLKRDALNGKHVVNLVISCAILGKGPDWHADRPDEAEVSVKGKPRWFVMLSAKDGFGRSYRYEADGYDRKKQRPVRGAYRKYALASSLRGAILSRLDWQLWQDALSTLHSELRHELKNTELLPFVPDRAPWVTQKFSSTSAQASEIA